jgi:hypothetical protein
MCTAHHISAYNTVSYNWLEDQIKDNFTIDSASGVIASAVTPLIPNHEHIVFAECKDNDPDLQLTSL